MWILIFLFGITTLGLGWISFGYSIFLWFIGLFGKDAEKALNGTILPSMSVVVPCFNEAGHIVEKINNLKQQDYPGDKIEIIFADGGSEDGTAELIAENIHNLPNIKLLKCPKRGKIHQLNYALSKTTGEIIVNTDADGIMERDCLRKLSEEFVAHPEAAVVSPYTVPKNVSRAEEYYWLNQNKARVLETKAHTSSIAIAVCYAFKRSLLNCFPEDVIADDIYISYLANTLGYKTIYTVNTMVYELRGPKNTTEFVFHKFRKSNAFLRETLRFLYRVPEMSKTWQVIYITKLSQLLFFPWAIMSWVILTLALLSLHRYDVVVLGFLFLFALMLITHKIFTKFKIGAGDDKYPLSIAIKTFILSNLILIMTGLSYNFYIQDSSYKKIKKEQ